MLESKKYHLIGLDKVRPKIQLHSQYILDITQPFVLQPEFDTIIHLAALVNVGESEKIPVDYYMTNMIGTMNVLNFTDCTNFVFASTGAAEGCASAYGVSKRAAEDCVRDLCHKRGIDYTTFRFYNVIGTDGFEPTNPDGLMYNLIKAKDSGKFTIFGNDYTESWDGTCVRDYVHVNEICHALIDAIETPSNSIECLGHGVGYTVKEIVHLFQKTNDIDINIEYGPRRKGDLPASVLENVSPYMKHLYSMEELLKINA